MRRVLLALLLLLCPSLCWAEASRSFDGTNDQVSFGNNLDVANGNFTICGWAKLTENAAADIIAGKFNNASGTAYFLNERSTDILRCSTTDGTTQQLADGTTDLDGTWRHCCCRWEGGAVDDLFAYVDGTQEGSDTADTIGSLSNAVSFVVGESNDGVGDATGLIAYVYFDSALRTVTEIQELRFHAEGLDGTALLPLLGDATEIDWGPNDLSGTVTGSTTSSDGPPVSFGRMLPL